MGPLPVIVVDAANVVGSRPDGWWRDRAGAAERFVATVRAAVVEGRIAGPVIVVLEGQARRGVAATIVDGVEVVHAPGEGDDTIATVAAAVAADDQPAPVVVTADRGLTQRVTAAGAEVAGPRWLLERLDR